MEMYEKNMHMPAVVSPWGNQATVTFINTVNKTRLNFRPLKTQTAKHSYMISTW